MQSKCCKFLGKLSWLFSLGLIVLCGLTVAGAPLTTIYAMHSETIEPSDSNDGANVPCKARVAIIIDDIGSTKGYMDEIEMIHEPLTWAILPFASYSARYIAEGKQSGHELLLHLPLEPISKANDPGPGVICTYFSNEEIIRQLDLDLDEVADIVGVNNHMGSAGTSDTRLMNVIMGELKRRNLIFVDSLTYRSSVAGKCARKNGVLSAQRDIFIDDDADYPSKINQLEKLMQIALKRGSAVAIGHPRKGTGTAIKAMLPRFKAAGIEIVPITELAE